MRRIFFAVLCITGLIALHFLYRSEDQKYDQKVRENAKIVESMGGYPKTVAEGLAITKATNDRIAFFTFYQAPHEENNFKNRETYTRVHLGYYFTVLGNYSCEGNYPELKLQMHEKQDGVWKTTREIPLGPANFNNTSGSVSFNVEGVTLVVVFNHDW